MPSENAAKLPGIVYDLWASLSEGAREGGRHLARIGPAPAAPRAWRPAANSSLLSQVPHTPPPAKDTKKQRQKQKQKWKKKGGSEDGKSGSGGRKAKARQLRRRRRQAAYLERFPLAAEAREPGGDLDAAAAGGGDGGGASFAAAAAQEL